MTELAHVDRRIVDQAFDEAHDLLEELRLLLDKAEHWMASGLDIRQASALSQETIKAIANILCCVNWLQIHRTYLNGELSAIDLKWRGRLSIRQSGPEPRNIALLESAARHLILESQDFLARVTRLNLLWHGPRTIGSPVSEIHERLNSTFRGP